MKESLGYLQLSITNDTSFGKHMDTLRELHPIFAAIGYRFNIKESLEVDDGEGTATYLSRSEYGSTISRDEVLLYLSGKMDEHAYKEVAFNLDKQFPQTIWEDTFPLCQTIQYLFDEHSDKL